MSIKKLFFILVVRPAARPAACRLTGMESVKKLLDCFPVLFLSEKFKNDILVFFIDFAHMNTRMTGHPG
jgi:hypothetical protein